MSPQRYWKLGVGSLLPHAVDGIGIAGFICFLRLWPQFYDRGPPFDWTAWLLAMSRDAAMLWPVIFVLDLLPHLAIMHFAPNRKAWEVNPFGLPFLNALLFGAIAAIIASFERQQILFFFLLHFVPIFLLELAVFAIGRIALPPGMD